PAVLLRCIDTEQPEFAATVNEVAGQLPVLVLESIEIRQHFPCDELVGGLSDEAVLVGQLFRREDAGRRLLEEPRAAVRERCRGRSHKRSRMPAAPMPPPIHIVTRP